jgi:hypothetical protein
MRRDGPDMEWARGCLVGMATGAILGWALAFLVLGGR